MLQNLPIQTGNSGREKKLARGNTIALGPWNEKIKKAVKGRLRRVSIAIQIWATRISFIRKREVTGEQQGVVTEKKN